jgi:hypothetical protein
MKLNHLEFGPLHAYLMVKRLPKFELKITVKWWLTRLESPFSEEKAPCKETRRSTYLF